jgi:hypothetical protein
LALLDDAELTGQAKACGGQGLIAAPSQGHLDSVIEEIEFQLENNPDLMNSVALTNYGKPNRCHGFLIVFVGRREANS